MNETDQIGKIGRNIRYFRELNGFTQKELAERLGVTEKAVSSWEVNSSTPRIGKIQRMSQLFNVPVTMILSELMADPYAMKEKITPDYVITPANGEDFEPIILEQKPTSAPSANKLSEEEKTLLLSMLARLDVNQLQRIRNYVNTLIDLKQ